MPNLKELEGQVIAIFFVNQAYPNGLQRIKAKLSHVDDHGIWLENQQLTEDTLRKLDLAAAQHVMMFFYPYAAIHAIVISTPGLSLSETAFGM